MIDAASRGRGAARDLTDAVSRMLADAERLPTELLTWQPAPGAWSVMDILCHVEEFIPYWMGEVVQVIRRPQEPWGRDHSHAGRLAAVSGTAARTLGDVTSNLRSHAGQAAVILASLSDADLATEATSRNPRWATKPASFIVDHLLVQHVEKHIGQVARNVAQFQQRRQSTS